MTSAFSSRRHGLLEIRFRDFDEQILQRGDVADDQVMKETAFAAVFPGAEFAFQRLDSRFEARRGCGQALLEQALKRLEAVVAERLGETGRHWTHEPRTALRSR